jgi:hypothetical protein
MGTVINIEPIRTLYRGSTVLNNTAAIAGDMKEGSKRVVVSICGNGAGMREY